MSLPGKYWVWVGWAWVGPLYCSWVREGVSRQYRMDSIL